VTYSVVQNDQFPSSNFHLLVWQMNANLALKRMDRNSGIHVMLIHLRVGLHKDENDMEVGVFGECLRTAPGVSLPRILISELL
jgi:hypothetical protein